MPALQHDDRAHLDPRAASDGGTLASALHAALGRLLRARGEAGTDAAGQRVEAREVRVDEGLPLGAPPLRAPGPADSLRGTRSTGARHHSSAHEGADHRGQPAAFLSVHGSTLRASKPEVSVE